MSAILRNQLTSFNNYTKGMLKKAVCGLFRPQKFYPNYTMLIFKQFNKNPTTLLLEIDPGFSFCE